MNKIDTIEMERQIHCVKTTNKRLSLENVALRDKLIELRGRIEYNEKILIAQMNMINSMVKIVEAVGKGKELEQISNIKK